MLIGKAKTEYMREYMRRKRAGLITRKEPKDHTKRLIRDIRHWVYLSKNRSRDLRETGRAVIAGLHLEDGDEAQWTEACRRYQDILDQQKQNRKNGKSRRHWRRRPSFDIWFCRVCGDAKWPGCDKLFIGDDEDSCLCEDCVNKAAKQLAEANAVRPNRARRV